MANGKLQINRSMARGLMFDFGVPVYSQITLKNPWDIEKKVLRCYLDTKAGFQEILIPRISNAGQSDEQNRFRTILSRDYRLDNEGRITLHPLESIRKLMKATEIKEKPEHMDPERS